MSLRTHHPVSSLLNPLFGFALLLAAGPLAAEVLPARGETDPAEWRREEYPLHYHWRNLPVLADSVKIAPDGRAGWFARPLWRHESYAPFNARVLENFHSLAYFYGHDAPWNRYRGNPELLRGLEAVLQGVFGLMDANGALSEYAEPGLDHPMLAPSSFGAEYLASVLDLAGPALPATLRAGILDRAERATRFVLTSKVALEHGDAYTNQYFGALVAAEKLARLGGDPELAAMVGPALDLALERFVAAPGYLYEADGPETFGYFFVSLARLVALYNERPDPRLVELARRHCDWIGYWLLPEPGGQIAYFSTSHQTRTSGQGFVDLAVEKQLGRLSQQARTGNWPWTLHGLERLLAAAPGDLAPLALFFPSQEALAAWQTRWADSPEGRAVDDAAVSGWYPPVSTHVRYEPAARPQDFQARALQSAAARRPGNWTHATEDARGNRFRFVRRAEAYLGYAFGAKPSRAQDGPAFLWHERHGTLILARNGDDLAWETLVSGRSTVRAKAKLHPRAEVATDELTVEYPELGLEKNYVLADDGLSVQARASRPAETALRERIPVLLEPGDRLTFDYGETPAALLAGGRDLVVVTRRLSIERAGVRRLSLELPVPVEVALRRRTGGAGEAFVCEVAFPYPNHAYRRTGYRLAW